MRLLLDTHVFLWAVDGALPDKTRAIIDEATEVYVSSASIWEISIKARLGKLDADPVFLASLIAPSGFRELQVSAAHAAAVFRLLVPANGHTDPFDRLLAAQALTEPLILLTADARLSQYAIPMVHV